MRGRSDVCHGERQRRYMTRPIRRVDKVNCHACFSRTVYSRLKNVLFAIDLTIYNVSDVVFV